MQFLPEEALELARLMRHAGLSEVEIYDGELSIRLLHPDADQASLPESPHQGMAQPTPDPDVLRSHAIGRFVSLSCIGMPSPQPGTTVRKGTFLGAIRLGPLYRAVVAPFDARLLTQRVCEDELVDFGVPLFDLEPNQQARSPAHIL